MNLSYLKHPLPEELHETYQQEKNAFNSRQIKITSIIVIVVSSAFLFQNLFFPREVVDEAMAILYRRLFISMIITGLLYSFICHFSPRDLSVVFKKNIHFLFISLYIFYLMGLVYVDLHFGNEITGYIIILMYVSAILWVSPRDYLWLSGLILLLLNINFLILAEASEVYQYIQGFLYYGLSWALYWGVYAGRKENFLNRITLEQQYRMLETESATDPLTGLYNRRHMNDVLQEEASRCIRSNSCFCILLLDMDNFKSINDDFGHLTGDEVIREMASLLRNSVRLSDKVFRFGGEEFLILLPEIEIQDAQILAERIRVIIETHSFNGIRRKITASIGLSQSRKEYSVDFIIEIADKRLYQAKGQGRNCVVWQAETQ